MKAILVILALVFAQDIYAQMDEGAELLYAVKNGNLKKFAI